MKRSLLATLLMMMAFIWVQGQTYEEGMQAAEYENYATARSILLKVVAKNPTDTRSLYKLGILYSLFELTDSARIVHNAGIQANPKDIANHIGMGRTYLDQNNVQKAQEYFDKARYLTNQKDVNYYVMVADAYSSSSNPNYQQALTLLAKAIEITNKNAEVYWVQGQTYEAQNRGGEAVSAYERSIELQPQNAKAHTRIGVIWRMARNYNLSLASFQKALEADPNFPPAYREMAELYFYTGQFDRATETYQKYLSMAEKSRVTDFRYAQFLFLTKKYKESLDILEELKEHSDLPVLWRMLGYSNYELGNYAESLDQLNQFFKMSSEAKVIASDYEYMGKALLKTGNDSSGLRHIEMAVQMDSTKYALYNEVAKMYYDKKKYGMAAMMYSRKIDASPKNAELVDYFNAGRSYYLDTSFLKADSAFAKLINLNRAWPIGYLWRARIHANLDSKNSDSIQGLAAPFYQMVVEKASVDTVKYQKELVEAYKYLGDINAIKENYGASLYYYSKALTYSPGNPDIKSTMDAVREQYKLNEGGSIAATKDSGGGFTIPVIINGNSISAGYSGAVTGIAVSEEGTSQLAGMKADILKIGDRSIKGIPVTKMDSLFQPVVIGADVLNKMNIVFDYSSSSLVFR